jgi:hypothetical protein
LTPFILISFKKNVNSSSGFQPRDARLKSAKIVSRATRGSQFYPFVELTLKRIGITGK